MAERIKKTIVGMSALPENIDIAGVVTNVFKIPAVKIDREKYLRAQLEKHYPKNIVDLAVKKNPAFAGISKYEINKIANHAIEAETRKTSFISAAAGMPGGLAAAATIPADVTQYFASVLRIMQKLLYLYGFEELNVKNIDSEVDEETVNMIILFLGVMFGVKGAQVIIDKLATTFGKKLTSELMKKALTKTAYYPIIKQIAKRLGIQMTKEIFAKNVGKAVPVIAGVMSGGITYISFKPGAKKLKHSLWNLPICEPAFYEEERKAYIQQKNKTIDI